MQCMCSQQTLCRKAKRYINRWHQSQERANVSIMSTLQKSVGHYDADSNLNSTRRVDLMTAVFHQKDLCYITEQSVSITQSGHSLFIIELQPTVVTHSDQTLVTDVWYCHRVAGTLSTQRLTTVPTVMLTMQQQSFT